ncbi:MAG: hypothetical protein ACP5I1_20615 [Candidatus Hinthialibacter sp.]
MIYLSFQTDSPPLTWKDKLQLILHRILFGFAFVFLLTLVGVFILSVGFISLIIGGVASLFMLGAYGAAKLFGWKGREEAWLDAEKSFMDEDLNSNVIIDFQDVRPPKSAKKQPSKEDYIDAEFYEEKE